MKKTEKFSNLLEFTIPYGRGKGRPSYDEYNPKTVAPTVTGGLRPTASCPAGYTMKGSICVENCRAEYAQIMNAFTKSFQCVRSGCNQTSEELVEDADKNTRCIPRCRAGEVTSGNVCWQKLQVQPLGFNMWKDAATTGVDFIRLQRLGGATLPIHIEAVWAFDDTGALIEISRVSMSTQYGSPDMYGGKFLQYNDYISKSPGQFPHTSGARGDFIELFLGWPRLVSKVVIVNRTDCCQERMIGVQMSLLRRYMPANQQVAFVGPVFGDVRPYYAFHFFTPASNVSTDMRCGPDVAKRCPSDFCCRIDNVCGKDADSCGTKRMFDAQYDGPLAPRLPEPVERPADLPISRDGRCGPYASHQRCAGSGCCDARGVCADASCTTDRKLESTWYDSMFAPNRPCGAGRGQCPEGQCCNVAAGWCGTSSTHCQSGMTRRFDGPDAPIRTMTLRDDMLVTTTTDGKCGPSNGYKRCPDDACCDENGNCGNGPEQCVVIPMASRRFDGPKALRNEVTTNGVCGINRMRCPDGQCCRNDGRCTLQCSSNRLQDDPQYDGKNAEPSMQCGPLRKCPANTCCSSSGWCGATREHCVTDRYDRHL